METHAREHTRCESCGNQRTDAADCVDDPLRASVVAQGLGHVDDHDAADDSATDAGDDLRQRNWSEHDVMSYVTSPVAELAQHVGAVMPVQRRRCRTQQHGDGSGPHERTGIDGQASRAAEHVDQPARCAERGQLGDGRDSLNDGLGTRKRFARHRDRHGRSERRPKEGRNAATDQPHRIDHRHRQPVDGGEEWDHRGGRAEGKVCDDEHTPS